MANLTFKNTLGVESKDYHTFKAVGRFNTCAYRLKGKYALITGADSGIGRAAAIMFAREGLKGLTFSHLPQEAEDAKAAAAAIAKEGCDVNVVALDLQHEAECQRLVQSHMSRFGVLNVLVNNASKQM